MISAIIPVYNNDSTIGHVLRAVGQCKRISEIIAVNDGSTDGSEKIIKKFSRVHVVKFSHNRGKGAAVAAGLRKAKNIIIIGIDADLAKLSIKHLDAIIDVYELKQWDMVIAARERPFLFDRLSGERVYQKSVVAPYLLLIEDSGNGVEQIINFAYRTKRIKIIYSKNIGHILRYQRGSLLRALVLYLHEGWQLIRTAVMLLFIR